MEKFTQTLKKCPFVMWIVISVIIVSVVGLLGVATGRFDTKISFQQPMAAVVFNSSAQNWADQDAYEEGMIPKTTTHTYMEVEDEWFQDALIIGDSSIEELSAYGGLDTATYAYRSDLSTENIFEDTLHVTEEGNDLTLKELFADHNYSKIYLMVGKNDLNVVDTETFSANYQQILDGIRKMQPDTTFFLLSIPAVTEVCSQEEGPFQNNMIYAYNYEIKQLTDEETSLYFNLNQVCCDATGALKEEYTTDGIQLRAEYYPLWAEYIKEHGIE